MRQVPRRADDADVIRARLRVLLDDGSRGGWVPEDRPEGGTTGGVSWPGRPGSAWDRHGPAGTPHADDRDPDVPDDVLDTPDDDLDGEVERGRPAGLGRHRAPGPAVRWNPGRRGARALWMAALLAALAVIGGTWLDRPRVAPAPPDLEGSALTTSAPAPGPLVGEAAGTATTVVVAVVGSVGRPGLVAVPTGSRVADAVEAAGGLLPGTDPAAVNLAAVVSDGQQIAVGVPGAGASSPLVAGTASGVGGPVNLNTATAQDLDTLPGIGPVLAQRIVAHRSEQGLFRSVDELDDVPGIGPAIAAELAELVVV